MRNILAFIMLLSITHICRSQNLQDCSLCSTKIIGTAQIKDLSLDELRFLNNDLFARKGYIFQDPNIEDFYSIKNWYKPVNSNADIKYSSMEKENIKLFQDRAAGLKSERDQLLVEIKILKELFNSGSKDEIKKRFNFTADLNNNYLSKILDQIDLADVHWFGKEALFNIKKDNGDMDTEYTLKITDDTVIFEYALRGGSGLAEGKSMYPVNNFSEYSFIYTFRFKYGKLVFEKLMSLG